MHGPSRKNRTESLITGHMFDTQVLWKATGRESGNTLHHVQSWITCNEDVQAETTLQSTRKDCVYVKLEIEKAIVSQVLDADMRGAICSLNDFSISSEVQGVVLKQTGLFTSKALRPHSQFS